MVTVEFRPGSQAMVHLGWWTFTDDYARGLVAPILEDVAVPGWKPNPDKQAADKVVELAGGTIVHQDQEPDPPADTVF